VVLALQTQLTTVPLNTALFHGNALLPATLQAKSLDGPDGMKLCDHVAAMHS
jgi:hypothetical protein